MPDKPSKGDVEAPPPDFAAFLASLNKGRSNRDLSEKLALLVEAVEETGKQGKISYTITIKPQKAGGMVVVTDEIKTGLPRGERPESVCFIGPGFTLLRNPHNQPSIFDEVTEGTRK